MSKDNRKALYFVALIAIALSFVSTIPAPVWADSNDETSNYTQYSMEKYYFSSIPPKTYMGKSLLRYAYDSTKKCYVGWYQ